MKYHLIICSIISANSFLYSADTLFFKLHFIYGSKSKRAYKHIEQRYFGGIHGGHVFTEANNQVVSFGPNNGEWHLFSHKKRIAGKYRIDKDLIWQNDTSKLKITSVYIPITKKQALHYTQITTGYLAQAPYDYAFFGMRCASAAYDIISNLGISKKQRKVAMIIHYFYPKKLLEFVLHSQTI